MKKNTSATARKDRDAKVNSAACPANGPSDTLRCEERLRFEALLCDLSASFINLPPDRLDSAIENAQRQICECLELDLSALWEWSGGESPFLTVTHLYGPPDGPSRPERIDAKEAFPWVFQAMMRGETLILSTEDMPPEAARDRESRRHFGVKSSVVIPLAAGGGPLMGVLAFDTLREERSWPDEIVKRFSLVAEIFANALIRRRAEEQLRESEVRLSLAADSAEAGIWELDCRTNVFWATEKARTIFGYAPRELISMERFKDSIHPDDQALVRGAIERALQENEPVDLEYRIHFPDGSMKWIASRGRPFFHPGGEPERILGVSIDITRNKERERELQAALQEVKNLRDQLQVENIHLREQVSKDWEQGTFFGESEPIQKMFDRAKRVASTSSVVLITGETGSGKELLATSLHSMSSQKRKAMVKVNCAALPPTLIESELFGREKGAYTGAMSRQLGRFEAAEGSTIFLDEIGDLPLELQTKLLRVLQDGQYERLGSSRTLTVHVRVITATNRNLQAMVREGSFREDLFHRLNVFPIEVPPLRNRPADIPMLTWKFVEEFNSKMGRSIDVIPRKLMDRLRRNSWPGNVRELRNLIERAMIMSDGNVLEMELPDSETASVYPPATLEDVERRHIREVMERTRWRISGKGGAAEILGLARTTLHSRMKKLGISRPNP